MMNIVFITVDSLRADHLGCYGYHRDTSPELDRLARDGHIFEKAFAHAGATRSSFPSILTSSYPMMCGGFECLSSDRTLISEVLDKAGYTTAGFHSNPYLSAEFGYDRGFDRFHDWRSDSTSTAWLRRTVRNTLDNDGLLFRAIKKAYQTTEQTVGMEFGSPYTPADKITDRAIEFIEDIDDDDSAFIWVHYMDAHHPYVPPERYKRAICDDPIDDRRSLQLRQKMLEEPGVVTEAERQQLVDLYDAEIKFTDAEISRLVDSVRAHWSDDTAVAVTADHGEEFREHGQFSHLGRFYEETIHVPLLVDWHGSGTHDEIVGLVDVAPTIATIANADRPDNFHGYTLTRLLDGEEWPRDAVVGRVDEKRYYRDDRWKYMDIEGDRRLFDLDTDPGETENLLDTDTTESDDAAEKRERVVKHAVAAINDLDSRIQDTARTAEAVEMNSDLKDRLRRLGYKE